MQRGKTSGPGWLAQGLVRWRPEHWAAEHGRKIFGVTCRTLRRSLPHCCCCVHYLTGHGGEDLALHAQCMPQGAPELEDTPRGCLRWHRWGGQSGQCRTVSQGQWRQESGGQPGGWEAEQNGGGWKSRDRNVGGPLSGRRGGCPVAWGLPAPVVVGKAMRGPGADSSRAGPPHMLPESPSHPLQPGAAFPGAETQDPVSGAAQEDTWNKDGSTQEASQSGPCS